MSSRFSRIVMLASATLLAAPLWAQLSTDWMIVRRGRDGREPVRSPEVSADGRVTFRLNGPQAAKVSLLAGWLQDPAEMSKDAEGVWSLTVGPLPPEIYTYSYSVDGVRVTDPHNPWVKTGVGSPTSLFEVHGPEPAFYSDRNVPHGVVRIHHYYSDRLKETRRVHIYTPPGYERSKASYPVLYLLHGVGDNDAGWTLFGNANFILDNLIADKKAKPMIVVMPYGHTLLPGGRMPERDEFVQRFSDELFQGLIPMIESSYRAKKDPDSRAIAGLSMGGGQSTYVGLANIDKFHWVGSFSGAMSSHIESKAIKSFLAAPEKANRSLKLLWIACGEDDRLVKANEDLVALLTQNGIHHTWERTAGAHTWDVWRRYLNQFAQLLFQ